MIFNKYKFIQVVFLFIVIPLSNCFSDDSNVFPSQALKAWAELKNKIFNGIDLELECQFNKNDPSKMHISVWKTCELNHHFSKNGETLEVINPNYQFSLSRQSSSSPWKLAEMNDNLDNARVHRQFTHGLLQSSTFAFGALMIEAGWISDLLNSESFEIVSINNIKEKNLIKVNFRCQHNLDKNNKLLFGTMTFDPNNFWSLIDCDLTIEFSYTTNTGKNIRTYRVEKHYSYQDNHEVAFFPRTVETTSFHEGIPPIQDKIEYTSLKLGKPEKDIFYMSHYGFPEPSYPMQRGDVIRIILMVAGLIMILIGLYMKFLAKRMK
ncbi:MAG: hypothetical protein LBT05_05595 [Planctomycetaceae bacterium]|jgi:hypothetical protein|nr:hypothetical protein [Planctomycetaceae bacterium]